MDIKNLSKAGQGFQATSAPKIGMSSVSEMNRHVDSIKDVTDRNIGSIKTAGVRNVGSVSGLLGQKVAPLPRIKI